MDWVGGHGKAHVLHAFGELLLGLLLGGYGIVSLETGIKRGFRDALHFDGYQEAKENYEEKLCLLRSWMTRATMRGFEILIPISISCSASARTASAESLTAFRQSRKA